MPSQEPPPDPHPNPSPPQPDEPGVGPKIPQALEKILQLKESRQEELSSVPGLTGQHPWVPPGVGGGGVAP